jgi:hypothetical protein
MDQAVSLRPLTAEARVQFQVSRFEICGRQSATGTGFYPSTSVFSGNISQPMLHTHLYLHVAVTGKTNGRGLGTFQKAMLFQNSGTLDRKVHSLFIVFKGKNKTETFFMQSKRS